MRNWRIWQIASTHAMEPDKVTQSQTETLWQCAIHSLLANFSESDSTERCLSQHVTFRGFFFFFSFFPFIFPFSFFFLFRESKQMQMKKNLSTSLVFRLFSHGFVSYFLQKTSLKFSSYRNNRSLLIPISGMQSPWLVIKLSFWKSLLHLFAQF